MLPTQGQIISLFTSQVHSKAHLQQPYLLLDNHGILHDKYYKKDIQRSILITSLESYALLNNHKITIAHGSLGENILMDYNPYSLSAGSQLQIGSVVLEITEHCTICNHLSSLDTQIPKILKNDRGIFAKVIQGGKIEQGDNIVIL